MTASHRPPNRATEAAQLRTRAWVGKCLLDTGQKNLNALSLFVEPELQWVSGETGERSRTNKWRGYRDGTRSPRVALVDKVARLEVNGRACTATRELFFHVLWSLLGTADPKPSAVAGWLKQFEPAVMRVTYGARWLPEAPSEALVPELSLRDCRRLERLASFDALALSTLVFLEAHTRGRRNAARSAGWCVFKLLHIMQPMFAQLGVDGPMLTFYQRWILDCRAGKDDPACLGDDIPVRIRLIDALLARMRHVAECVDTVEAKQRELRAFFDGKYGLPMLKLMRSPFRAIEWRTTGASSRHL